MKAKLYTDAGFRPVSGVAGGAYILYDEDDNLIEAYAWPIPAQGNTNNTAEYQALLMGMVNAIGHGVAQLDVYMDSKLVIQQMRGEYKVKAPTLQNLFIACMHIADCFDEITFTHVYRTQNQVADRLAGKAASQGETFLYTKDARILEEEL